jgi:ER membrane protein complex subunit 4
MPGKSLPMNLLMMWMSGNSIQIFSILIVCMLLFNGIKGILGVQKVFAKLGDPNRRRSSLFLPKCWYLFLNVVLIGLAMYKCRKLGLLPNNWQSLWYRQISRDGGEDLRYSTGPVFE